MSLHRPTPTGRECYFAPEEIIVSKTDLKGLITYANSVFVRVSGYTEEELIGQPHNMIRHPEMPRSVFKLLWDRLESGREVFAYVKNITKSGDQYWVYAHVTPTFDSTGKIRGYHSNRRTPSREGLAKVEPLYQSLLRVERSGASKSSSLAESSQLLFETVKKTGMEYDEFVFSLEQ